MKRRKFAPRLEQLEQRHLLAGNVHVQIIGGDLVVQGDDAANRISVESAGTGKILVRGFGTQINSVANGAKIISGIRGEIQLNLGGGDDLVRVSNLIAPSNVLVSLGSGNDEVVTGRDRLNGDARFGHSPSGPLYVRGDLRIYGGGGDDLVFQSDAHVDGLGVVNLGKGDDTLFLQRPFGGSQNVDYGGNLSIVPDQGDDVVDILGMVVDGNLTVDDAAGRLYLVARSLDVHGDCQITSGNLADSVEFSATNVRNQLSINTGAGDDRVRVSAIAKSLRAQLGSGNDGFDLISANIESTTVSGGDGNDVFFARYAYGDAATFFGDDGSDTFRTSRSLPNGLSSVQLQSIEATQTLI
jgi:hypothetical protein